MSSTNFTRSILEYFDWCTTQSKVPFMHLPDFHQLLLLLYCSWKFFFAFANNMDLQIVMLSTGRSDLSKQFFNMWFLKEDCVLKCYVVRGVRKYLSAIIKYNQGCGGTVSPSSMSKTELCWEVQSTQRENWKILVLDYTGKSKDRYIISQRVNLYYFRESLIDGNRVCWIYLWYILTRTF